jgi:hypothetical protein
MSVFPNTLQRQKFVETSLDLHNPARPYKVVIKYGNATFQEMFEWCNDHYGLHISRYNNPRWSCKSWQDSFWFKKERDRTMFLLRWS